MSQNPFLTVRMSPDERQAISTTAARQGVTVADLIRRGLASQGVPIATRNPRNTSTPTRKAR